MESSPRPESTPPPDPGAPITGPADAGTVDCGTTDCGEADSTGASPGADNRSPDDTKSVRAARLELIREQIAAGAYDSPDRLDAALDGLLADLLD